VTLHLTGYITPPYIDSVSTSTIYVLDSRSRRNRYGLLGSLTLEPLFVKRPDPTTTPLHHHLCAYYIKRLNVTYRTMHIFYLWLRPAQTGDGLRNLLTPGNTELGETSGTRNFLSLTSCCLCLWRRPAQPGDGPLNAYLLSLATASATWQRPAHPLSLTAAASANAIMLIQVIRLRLSWSNGTSPFPPLNSAKIDTCLVLSRLYEITSEIVTLYLTGYVTSPYIDSVSTSTIYVLKSELPAQNGECFKNVRTRIQSLSERKHCCLILPRPVDTECTL